MNDNNDLERKTEDGPSDIDPIIEPIFEKIAEIIKENKIKDAAFIFTLEGFNEPFLYFNHEHFYDAAKLLASCVRKFKGAVARDLEC